MQPTSTPYTSFESYETRPTFRGVNWDEIIEDSTEAGTLTHEDIPTFSFASLDQIERDLEEQGYSEEEIESTIVGLSELPEYADSKRNKKGRK